MDLKVCLILLLFIVNEEMCVNARDVNFEHVQTRLRSIGGSLWESFVKFLEKIKMFFRMQTGKVENRRQRIKNAFHTFVNQSFGDGKNKNVRFSSAALESEMSTPQLISYHGYRVESHTVLTSDGYLLTLHRVLPILQNTTTHLSETVLLHHGLLGSSADWVLLGPKRALPYLLTDAGYDVWLANARGNRYSKAHASKAADTHGFWDFSFHEIGTIDLPAIIDYVRETTQRKSHMSFIGHSMGGTAVLVLLSTTPRYNHVFRSVTLLAPLSYMNHVKGPFRLLAEFHSTNNFDALGLFGHNEFMPFQAFPLKLMQKFCIGEEKLCLNPLLFLSNGGQLALNDQLKIKILGHSPAGGSTKTISHYCQLVKSGQFQLFDLGRFHNFKKYGMETPPLYRLKDITAPIAIFSSSDDWLSTIPDTMSLLPQLPNPIAHHVIRRHDFSHTDFVWAEDAPELLFYLILDVLKHVVPHT